MSEPRQRKADTQVAGVARHGRLSRASAWKSVLALLGGTLAVLLTAGVSVAGIAVWQLQNQIETVEIAYDAGGGVAVAMGQAPEEVTSVASEVTATDLEDGLAAALTRHFQA